MVENKITPLKATIIYVTSTVYFFTLLFTLLPFLKSNFPLIPALYWFITGLFLFIPLFMYAIIMAKGEGNNGIKRIMQALTVKSFSKKDWGYSIIGLLLVFVFTGLIYATSFLLSKFFGIRALTTMPWFMVMEPFQGLEKLLLLVWLPMFFFNIVGEELLWRGYIQKRLQGKYAWLLCSLLWAVFHLPFGIDIIIMAIPAFIIIPYVYNKTQNALTGIFIHGIYNGPLFVLIALGIIK